MLLELRLKGLKESIFLTEQEILDNLPTGMLQLGLYRSEILASGEQKRQEALKKEREARKNSKGEAKK